MEIPKMALGSRMRELADDKSMNIKDFCAFIETSESTMQNYLRGSSTPNGEFLLRINAKIGVSPSWLLLGQGTKYGGHCDAGEHAVSHATERDFISVPRFDVAASAGTGSIAESEIGTGHYAFNRAWLDRRGLETNHLAVIAVRGDSMEPELYDGDLILLDRSRTEPEDGDMFVVRYSDELFVKRVQKMPDRHIALRSTNNFYESIRIAPRESNDISFIGCVIASMHEW